MNVIYWSVDTWGFVDALLVNDVKEAFVGSQSTAIGLFGHEVCVVAKVVW